MKAYSEVLLKFYKDFPNGKTVRFFVSLRPQPYRHKKSVKGESIVELKDGVHILSPDVVMTAERQRVLRHLALNNDIVTGSFDGTDYINKADDIFDMSIEKLFEQENDFKEVIKKREIYQVLEIATDKIEDVSNVIESIIIKYA